MKHRLCSVLVVADPGSSRFRFVHAADLHLDTPFKGIHNVAPMVAEALREASLHAFDNIIDLAIEREATFVLFAGDIYDGAERGLRAQLRFRDGLARLSQHGILSFIVHGNHDPVTTGWSAINNSWPDGVTVFGSDEVEMVSISRDQKTIATVQGISYAIQATTENLSRHFRRPNLPGFHIGVLHCNVAGVEEGQYSNYAPCSLGDLRSSQLDYFALGHIHKRQILHESAGPGDPWVVYPGNSQARNPKRSEQEPKGAMVVEVDDRHVTSVEFVPCDVIRFGLRECDIAEIRDLGELEDTLVEIANDELEAADGRSVVLRVSLTGRGALHDDLSRAGVVDDLTTRLRETVGRSDRFCWWDRIDDDSHAEIDFNAVRGRGDFAADLLELSDEYLADEYSRRTVGDELVTAVPKAITGRLREIFEDDERLTEIFERATALAFDELLRETK